MAIRPTAPLRVLSREPCARRDVLRARRDLLAHRIAELRASLDFIDGALDCDHDDIAICPHFRAAVAQRLGDDPIPAWPNEP